MEGYFLKAKLYNKELEDYLISLKTFNEGDIVFSKKGNSFKDSNVNYRIKKVNDNRMVLLQEVLNPNNHKEVKVKTLMDEYEKV